MLINVPPHQHPPPSTTTNTLPQYKKKGKKSGKKKDGEADPKKQEMIKRLNTGYTKRLEKYVVGRASIAFISNCVRRTTVPLHLQKGRGERKGKKRKKKPPLCYISPPLCCPPRLSPMACGSVLLPLHCADLCHCSHFSVHPFLVPFSASPLSFLHN